MKNKQSLADAVRRLGEIIGLTERPARELDPIIQKMIRDDEELTEAFLDGATEGQIKSQEKESGSPERRKP